MGEEGADGVVRVVRVVGGTTVELGLAGTGLESRGRGGMGVAGCVGGDFCGWRFLWVEDFAGSQG